jgi:Family of unknown function (DUF5869)
MQRLEEWPQEWLETIYCTKQFDYPRHRETCATFKHSPYVRTPNLTKIEQLLGPDPQKFDLVKPHRIYQFTEFVKSTKSDLVVKFRTPGLGEQSWYIFEDPWIEAYCDSCDGKTDSSFTVCEYESLHDLVFNGLTEFGRRKFDIHLFGSISFARFCQDYSKKKLKKRLFGRI